MLNFIAKMFAKPKHKYKTRKAVDRKQKESERTIRVLKGKVWRLQRKLDRVCPKSSRSGAWTPERRKHQSEMRKAYWAKRHAEEASSGHTTSNGVS
jgi:hypothetical protein